MHGLYLRTECFLLWAIPPSFIVPAVWRASPPGVRSNVLHVTALGAALALCAASVAGSGAPGNPEWLAWLGRLAAPAMAALGILGAALLVRWSRRAASAAFMGGLAEAAWILWVRLHLFGTEPGPAQWLGAINVSAGILGWVMALLMVLTGADRSRGRSPVPAARRGLIRLSRVAGDPQYEPVRAGVGNCAHREPRALGERVDAKECRPPAPRRGLVLAGLIARGLVAALAGYMIFAVVTGRFDRATGARRRFGLREAPLAYAHNAAHFAGQPGLPDKALAYDLVQAGVYLFHNGPRARFSWTGG